MADLFKKQFSKDLQGNLFPDNAFYMNAKNDDAFVVNDKVELPHAGATPAVVVDRASLPGTPVKRTDTASEYDLHELSSTPSIIQYSEELITNYAKRASLASEHGQALDEVVGDFLAHAWGSSANVSQVRTTGTEVRASILPSATGDRKRIIKADILNVGTILNRQNLPNRGQKIAVITPDMLEDLFLIDEFANSDYNSRKPYSEGGKTSFYFMGFHWYVRSKVTVFDNTGTPVIKDIDAAGAATDNAGALFYHSEMVRRAKGAVKAFLSLDDPTYYGDLLSALVRVGGIASRTDGKGVVNLVETAGA